MSAFVSPRERNLWLGAAALVATIYATLGPAVEVVKLLRERNLLRLSVSALLLGVAIGLGVWLARRRPRRREVGVAVGFGLYYTGALAWLGRAEERLHLVEYGLLALLIHLALEERRASGRPPCAPSWLLAILATAALGWIDEGIQAILPSRVYDLRDVALNAAAGTLSVAAVVLLGRARVRDRTRRDLASGTSGECGRP